MGKIKTIILKEWAEIFKNRFVLFTVAFLPIILIALPIVTVVSTESIAGEELRMDALTETPEFMPDGQCEGLTETECVNAYMLDLYTLMLMILPVMIPVTIASYSIVGEKNGRSLEPLLATPITTFELIVGKAVAAMIPAAVSTWLAFFVYLGVMYFFVSASVFQRLLQPIWFLAIFVVGPLLSLLSVNLAMMVSSRTSDPRVAEQLSALVILPLIMLIVGQSLGFALINRNTIVLLGIAVVFVDAGLVYLNIRLFERETILTRWK